MFKRTTLKVMMRQAIGYTKPIEQIMKRSTTMALSIQSSDHKELVNYYVLY